MTLVAGMSVHSLYPVKHASLDDSSGEDLAKCTPHGCLKVNHKLLDLGTERKFCNDGSYDSQVIFLRFTCHQYEYQRHLFNVVVFLEEGMYGQHLVEGFVSSLRVNQEAELDICGENQMPLGAHSHVLT